MLGLQSRLIVMAGCHRRGVIPGGGPSDVSDPHPIIQEPMNPKINDDYHTIPRTTFQS
jgi:hypothetical protein